MKIYGIIEVAFNHNYKAMDNLIWLFRIKNNQIFYSKQLIIKNMPIGKGNFLITPTQGSAWIEYEGYLEIINGVATISPE